MRLLLGAGAKIDRSANLGHTDQLPTGDAAAEMRPLGALAHLLALLGNASDSAQPRLECMALLVEADKEKLRVGDGEIVEE